MRGRARARLLLIVWLALFVLLFLPWGDFQDHTHWFKVAWIPFGSRPVKPLDVIGNIVAFVPFGVLLTLALGTDSTWHWPLGLVAALLLAFGAEAAQLYSHTRFPSATDLAANVAGAALGIWLVRRGLHASSRRSAQL
jgi:glycopeptide antibiotics resistance protein